MAAAAASPRKSRKAMNFVVKRPGACGELLLACDAHLGGEGQPGGSSMLCYLGVFARCAHEEDARSGVLIWR